MKNRKWNTKGVSIPIALLVIACISLMVLSLIYFGIKTEDRKQVGIAGNAINVDHKAYLLDYYLDGAFENSIGNLDFKIKYKITHNDGRIEELGTISDSYLRVLNSGGATIETIPSGDIDKMRFINNFKGEIDNLKYPYIEHTAESEYNYFREFGQKYFLKELGIVRNKLNEENILDSLKVDGEGLVFDLNVQFENFYNSGNVRVNYNYNKRFIKNFKDNQ